jgi:hypothetical protein
MDYMVELKERLALIHFEHGTGGNPLICSECVFKTLNQVEDETRIRFQVFGLENISG